MDDDAVTWRLVAIDDDDDDDINALNLSFQVLLLQKTDDALELRMSTAK